LFEIAKRFLYQDDYQEKKTVAGLIAGNPHRGWRNSRKEEDFFDIKGILEQILQMAGYRGYRNLDPPTCLHPKRGAGIQVGKDEIGYYGELHPNLVERYEMSGRVLVFELNLQPLSDQFRRTTAQFKPYSMFPAIRRDMALLVPENVTAEQIEKIIRREGGNLLEDVEIFDYYRGKQVKEGFVSVAFRLTFRSAEGTLKEEAVDQTVNAIVKQLEKKQVELRS
jgi:phenylalanyl-tRNA synthetase beta chain